MGKTFCFPILMALSLAWLSFAKFMDHVPSSNDFGLDFPFSIFFPFNMSDPSICHGISAVTNFSGIFPGSPSLSHNFPRFAARRYRYGHQLHPGGGLGHQLLRDRSAGPDQAPRHLGTTCRICSWLVTGTMEFDDFPSIVFFSFLTFFFGRYMDIWVWIYGYINTIVTGVTRPGKRLQKTNWKDPPFIFDG